MASESLRDVGQRLDKLCILRPLQVLDSFTDAQVDSLLLDRVWPDIPFDEMIRAIHEVKEKFSTWHDFKTAFTDNDGNMFIDGMTKFESLANKLLNNALIQWLPLKVRMHQMRDMLSKMRVKTSPDNDSENSFANQDVQDSNMEVSIEDEKTAYDEDMIMEAQAQRKSAVDHLTANRTGLRPKEITIMGNLAVASNHPNVYQFSDFPTGIEGTPKVIRKNIDNLWSMDECERIQYIYGLLVEQSAGLTEKFDELAQEVNRLKREIDSLDTDRKLEIAMRAKIIGVTITGASIQHKLIQRLRPKVVIIEEAGEILEPSLLAALSPDTEHLILIGDHQQLKPTVETYKLCTDYSFNTSMMERLITIDYPYKTLSSQNRMRPEFATLLHDLYPDLQDNLAIVEKNEPLPFMEKSMFFLHHDFAEEGAENSKENSLKMSRSKTNEGEAKLAVSFAHFLLHRGCSPKDITILVAYLGQKKIIRQLLGMKTTANGAETLNNVIDCQTIDTFQVSRVDVTGKLV